MGFRPAPARADPRCDAAPGRTLFSATVPRPVEDAQQGLSHQSAARAGSPRSGRRAADHRRYCPAIGTSPCPARARSPAGCVEILSRDMAAPRSLVFCAHRETRSAVRHVQGYGVVALLVGEHSHGERNCALAGPCATEGRGYASPPMSPRAGSTCPLSALSSMSKSPAMPKRCSTAPGRTGRAGRKGVAVLIVPFSGPPPGRGVAAEPRRKSRRNGGTCATAKAIGRRERERLLGKLLAPVEVEEADRDLAQRLLAERSPEEIAAMLVNAHRASLPEPEDLIANTPQARADAQKDRHASRLRGYGVVPDGCRSRRLCPTRAG